MSESESETGSDGSISSTPSSSSESDDDEPVSVLDARFEELGINPNNFTVRQSLSFAFKADAFNFFQLLSLIGLDNQISSLFLILVLAEILSSEGTKILCFVAFWFFYRGFEIINVYLTAQVKNQSKRSLRSLSCIVASILCLYIVIIGILLWDQQLYLGLVFIWPNVNLHSVPTLFWVIAMTIYTAKMMTILVKAMVVAIPPEIGPPYQLRGKYYLMIELISDFYQQLLPISPWLFFLGDGFSLDSLTSIILVLIKIGVYALYKLPILVIHGKSTISMLQNLQTEVHYGSPPNSEEFANADSNCSVCLRRLNWIGSTQLSCSHIFCTECIHKWLMTQARTCPNCREVIIHYDPLFRTGVTSRMLDIF